MSDKDAHTTAAGHGDSGVDTPASPCTHEGAHHDTEGSEEPCNSGHEEHAHEHHGEVDNHDHGHVQNPDHSHSHSHGNGSGHGHGHGHGHSHGQDHSHTQDGADIRIESNGANAVTVTVRTSDVHTPTSSRSALKKKRAVPERDAEKLSLLADNEEAKLQKSKRRRAKRALICALIFCIVFMIAEGVGGYYAHSIAVMTDAAHVATDVAALGLSLYALEKSGQPKCSKYTYGWHRMEIVGALVSLLSIWFLTGIIVYESTRRLMHKVQVNGQLMMILGGCGLLVNIVVALILSYGNASVTHFHSHGDSGECPSKGGGHSHGGHGHGGHGHSHGHSHDHGHSHGAVAVNDASDTQSLGDTLSTFTSVKKGENVNVKSAMIHAIGDCVQSIGVIIAAAIIWIGNHHACKGHESDCMSDFNYADPITSFLFAAVTLWTTAGMFRQVFNVLLESSGGLPYDQVAMEFEQTFGADKVHDLHLWSLTINKPALSVHIVSDNHVQTLRQAKGICTKHEIHHTTIQVDPVQDGVHQCISIGICEH